YRGSVFEYHLAKVKLPADKRHSFINKDGKKVEMQYKVVIKGRTRHPYKPHIAGGRTISNDPIDTNVKRVSSKKKKAKKTHKKKGKKRTHHRKRKTTTKHVKTEQGAKKKTHHKKRSHKKRAKKHASPAIQKKIQQKK